MIRCCASKSRTLASSCSALQFASLTGRNMWRRPRTCFLRSTARESSSSSSCYARSHRHGPHGLLRGAWARTHVMGTSWRERGCVQQSKRQEQGKPRVKSKASKEERGKVGKHTASSCAMIWLLSLQKRACTEARMEQRENKHKE